MIRTIIWFIYFFIIIILVAPFEACGFWLKKHKGREQKEAFVFPCVMFWAKSLLKLAGVKINVEGKENIPKKTVIFVSNHQGDFDIPVLLTSLDKPNAIVAKKEVNSLPLIRGWMKLLDCVFIDRENARSAMKTINEAIALVKGGRSLIVFPEGTRSRGGPVAPFKSGAFRICEKSQVPIVPIAINGTYKALEERKRIHPAEVTLKILPPIETSGMSREELKALAEKVREEIAKNI